MWSPVSIVQMWPPNHLTTPDRLHPSFGRDDGLEEVRESVDDGLEEVTGRIRNLELAYNSKIGLSKVWYADLFHHILTE